MDGNDKTTAQTILHVVSASSLLHRGGGTSKHIEELAKAFPDYQHERCMWGDVMQYNITHRICLLHIHTIWGASSITAFQQISMIHAFREREIPVYITIHDHQWIFPGHCTPSTEDLATTSPTPVQLEETQLMFDAATRVIFPSHRVLENFAKFMPKLLNNSSPNHVIVAPHCDIPIRYEQVMIPAIKQQEVHVAFLGHCVPHKGSHVFNFLVHHLPIHRNVKLIYHVFGGQHGTYIPNVIFHGDYEDERLIELLHTHGIHIVCILSIAEESYCYTLTRAINSGIPLVYLQRGALADRLALPHDMPRFFAAAQPNRVITAVQQAIEYVIRHEGERNYVPQDETKIQKPSWYKDNYPRTTKS